MSVGSRNSLSITIAVGKIESEKRQKIHMKQVIALIMVTLMILMTGCSSPKTAQAAQQPAVEEIEKTRIVTAFYPIHHFTKNLIQGIESVELINLAPPQTGCLHDYVLTPKDMKTLESADILIINGAGMEQFMDQVIENYPDLKLITATEGMELLEEAHVHDHDHEASTVTTPETSAGAEANQVDADGHEELAVNPHVWVSVSGAIAEVKNIAKGLRTLDSANKEAYDKNESDYLKRLEALKVEMDVDLKPLSGKSIVTFHEAFPYFAEEYDLNIAAVIEREPGSEPTAEELVDTIHIIEEHKIKVLFAEPQYSNKAAEVISKETGARLFQLDPFVTGSFDDPLDAYETVMRANKQVLLSALSGE